MSGFINVNVLASSLNQAYVCNMLIYYGYFVKANEFLTPVAFHLLYLCVKQKDYMILALSLKYRS